MIWPAVTFKDIPIGSEFRLSKVLESQLHADLHKPGSTVYTKISPRKYRDLQGDYRVGTINVIAWRVS